MRAGLYETWREIHCDSCGRIEFGRDEQKALANWQGVLLSADNTNEGPRCTNSNEPSDHQEPKEGSTDG